MANKEPSRCVTHEVFEKNKFLLPKHSLWCQYANPRSPEFLLTKKRINHRFYVQKNQLLSKTHDPKLVFLR